tara:strand:+ start:35421 stop:35780 length:360 start_codon:yes stop_codon:yes gene_type:complete
LGWLHSKAGKATRSRGVELGKDARLPPAGDAQYLLQMVDEIGYGVVEWGQIHAWASMTGTTLTPWEANAIRNINLAYLSALNEYEGKDVPPPWHDGKIDRAKVEDSVRKALRGRSRGNR